MLQYTLQGCLTQVSPLPGDDLYPITHLRLPAKIQGNTEGPSYLQSPCGTNASQFIVSFCTIVPFLFPRRHYFDYSPINCGCTSLGISVSTNVSKGT